MKSIALNLQALLDAMKAQFPLALKLLLVLWVIHILNWLWKYRLNYLGIIPRTGRGLIGIPLSPLLHADFNHLFFNSFPFLGLTTFILVSGIKTYVCVTLIIIFLSGFLVWLFARRAIHIGASSLIMGYFGYLLLNAYFHPSTAMIILIVIALYYFGSLFFNLIPTDVKTSWEGHVFGFTSGLFAVYACSAWF